MSLEVNYTVKGVVEKRTNITPSFCAIEKAAGRLEIGWKQEPHIFFNEVWLGYDVPHGEKERLMFGYKRQNTSHISITQPNNGEFFLSISLKDFPVTKHENVCAVTLTYNLTEHANQLHQAVQDALDQAHRMNLFKTMLEADKPSQAEADIGLKTAENMLKGIQSVVSTSEESVLPNALNDAAWFLSVYPVDAIRDGKKAVEYASLLLKQPQWLTSFRLDTISAAFAENGDYESAVKYQTQAMSNVADDARSEYAARLELYKRKQPYRQW